jgi:2-methylcitrate dehydratase PrpD
VPEQVFQVICEPVANKLRPKNDYDAKFSVQYLVATALVHGALGLNELEPAYLSDPATLALADRSTHAAFADSPFPKAYSGAVKITLDDGSVHEHSEAVNRGAADRPLSNAEITAKYRAIAALWAGPVRVARMEESLLALDDTPAAVDAFAPLSGA